VAPDLFTESSKLRLICSLDEAKNKLGPVFKQSWIQTTEQLGKRFISEDFAEALSKEREELERNHCTAVLDMYFCWAQREDVAVEA
jgi:hypothetical protein